MEEAGRLRMERRAVPGRGRSKADVWIVNARADIALRLKRVCGRVSKGSYGDLILLDTPEVRADLLWFLDRYPLAVSPDDLTRLKDGAREVFRRERTTARTLAGRGDRLTFPLAVPLREYQRIAAELAVRSGSLLLADEVGLGKTAAGIALLNDPFSRPGLVVTLAHLPRQWEREIRRFAPGLTVHVAKTGRPDEITKRKAGLPDVIVLNYHKLAKWADALAGEVRSIVFDEAQELRRPDSDKYRAAVHVARAARRRLGLSATPIFGYGGEMFHVLDVLRPDALGTEEEFRREWCAGWENDRPKIREPAAFGHWLRAQGLMLRRTRAEVGRELPPLSRFTQEVESDPAALDKIADPAAELARLILRGQAGEAGGKKGEAFRAAEELSWMLRQATGIGKARSVAAFCRLLVEQGERIVLFGWHREVYGLWEAALADLKPAFYTGAESGKAKDEAARRFVARETDVLIMSLRAGAGLDGLQGCCRTVVFGELDYSPAVHHQCEGRVFRDGQADPVVAYYLLAGDGSDPVVADILGLKRRQAEGIVDPTAPAAEPLAVDSGHVARLAEAFLAQRRKGGAA